MPIRVSGILATRPSGTNVRIRLCSRFAMDLVRNVLMGELNLAPVTAPHEENRITAVPFVRRSQHPVLPEIWICKSDSVSIFPNNPREHCLRSSDSIVCAAFTAGWSVNLCLQNAFVTFSLWVPNVTIGQHKND